MRSGTYCGVQAAVRGGGSLHPGLFMAKQECSCNWACLVWSDNKEHLQGPCWEEVCLMLRLVQKTYREVMLQDKTCMLLV